MVKKYWIRNASLHEQFFTVSDWGMLTLYAYCKSIQVFYDNIWKLFFNLSIIFARCHQMNYEMIKFIKNEWNYCSK